MNYEPTYHELVSAQRTKLSEKLKSKSKEEYYIKIDDEIKTLQKEINVCAKTCQSREEIDRVFQYASAVSKELRYNPWRPSSGDITYLAYDTDASERERKIKRMTRKLLDLDLKLGKMGQKPPKSWL